jgi:hypothetical protein
MSLTTLIGLLALAWVILIAAVLIFVNMAGKAGKRMDELNGRAGPPPGLKNERNGRLRRR